MLNSPFGLRHILLDDADIVQNISEISLPKYSSMFWTHAIGYQKHQKIDVVLVQFSFLGEAKSHKVQVHRVLEYCSDKASFYNHLQRYISYF